MTPCQLRELDGTFVPARGGSGSVSRQRSLLQCTSIGRVCPYKYMISLNRMTWGEGRCTLLPVRLQHTRTKRWAAPTKPYLSLPLGSRVPSWLRVFYCTIQYWKSLLLQRITNSITPVSCMNNIHTILMHFPHHIHCRIQKLLTEHKKS